MTVTYRDVAREISAMGEDNVCVPTAVAIALQFPFSEVLEWMAPYRATKDSSQGWWNLDVEQEKWGHKLKGANPDARGWINLVSELGVEVHRIGFSTWCQEWGIKTMITAERNLPKDRVFFVLSRGHVACVRYGHLEDWSEGRRYRVVRLWEVLGV